MPQQINIITQTDSDLAETKVFMGEDYLVVPVVAMVEGVRFGANQEDPELGLASEFGKYPISWCNRPLVVNHPKINDTFVSANLIEVLEEESFGFTANAEVKNGKLKLEAWILKSRADDLEEVKTFIEEIEEGNIIEVSVGFFSEVEKKKGKFKTQAYSGVWRNILPDHLAFLTHDKGACSIADGCGVPRINSAEGIMSNNNKVKAKTKVKEPKTTSKGKMKVDTSNEPCCDNCADGKTCETVLTAQTKAEERNDAMFTITTQEIANGLSSSSVSRTLDKALKKYLVETFDIPRYDIYYMTCTVGKESIAVYEEYSDIGFVNKGIRFDMDETGDVTFIGEPFSVRIITQIIETGNEENNMSNQKKALEKDSPKSQTETTVIKDVDGNDVTVLTSAMQLAEEPKVESKVEPKVEAKKETPSVLSQGDAIKTMSDEDQAIVKAALTAQAESKASAIKALQDTGRCKFSEDYLKNQSLETLENLIELSSVDDYTGRAPANEKDMQPNSQSDDTDFVAAPLVFTPKKSA